MNIEVTLSLTEAMAEEARVTGLLTTENLSVLIEADVEPRQGNGQNQNREFALNRLFGDLERLQAAIAEEGITPEDLEAEILAYHIEQASIKQTDSNR